jgi:two-component system, cell cycle sensor histidine kinase and response regulator CckA
MGSRPARSSIRSVLRLLLVEDDQAFSTFVTTALGTGGEPLELRTAADLSEALRELGDIPPDAVLLDLNLPDSQGLATLREVLAACPEVAVVVLTGLDDAAIARAALKLGAQDWLVKGELDPAVIHRAVRYAVERKKLTNSLVQVQKLEVVGRLATGVAHEFNNVLTAILGSAQLIEEAANAEAKASALALLRRAARQGTALSRQLLSLARNPPNNDAIVPVSSLIDNALGLIQAVLPASIQLVIGEIVEADVRLDPGQFDQVLLNLVLNAKDAMPEGGTLSLSVTSGRGALGQTVIDAGERGGSFATVLVSDTGTGIDPSLLPRLFDPFVTTKGSKGTGLGLAVVTEIVARFGGAVQVESRRGSGTTFAIILPTSTSTTPAQE